MVNVKKLSILSTFENMYAKNDDGSQTLNELMKKHLCLPNSWAIVKRIFSVLNVLKTKFLNRISTITLEGVWHTKSEKTDSYSFEASNRKGH